MNTIFVSIASYRDPECQWTVKDLFEKAKYPERIFVGICWQFIAAEDQEFFQLETRPDQVRRIDFDALESKGASWAKVQAMSLWQGEDYVLNIDSHMRFSQDWDEQMIDMLEMCPSEKSVLSTYPAQYTPPNILDDSTPQLVVKEFNERSDVLHLRSYKRALSQPKLNAFVAGGYIFSRAELFQQVPWDPNIYFYGEEITFAIRAWSYGWDIYTPHICSIYHYYAREEAIKHSSDNKKWFELAEKSNKRVWHLVGTKLSDDIAIESQFQLGKDRDLDAYQTFSGIDFVNLSFSAAASNGDVQIV
jgi:hypothetical protein